MTKYNNLFFFRILLVLLIVSQFLPGIVSFVGGLETHEVYAADSNGCDFYAAPIPTGSSGNSGSSLSPWDLQTALNKKDSLSGGKTLCLKSGLYKGIFSSSITGSYGNPVVVKPEPGARATLDGYDLISWVSGVQQPSAQAGRHTCTFSNMNRDLNVDDSLLVGGGEVISILGKINATTYDCLRGLNGTSTTTHAAGTPVIAGGSAILTVRGAYTWITGLEFTCSYTKRLMPRIGTSTNQVHRPGGILMSALGIKAINNVIHNVGHPAIASFANQNVTTPNGCDSGVDSNGQTKCTEAYGNLIYANGYIDTANGANRIGAGIYTQNYSGTKYLRDNIFFKHTNTGINVYTENGYVNNFFIEGNVSFSNGRDNYWLHSSNENQPMKNLRFYNNFSYNLPHSNGNGLKIGLPNVNKVNDFADVQNNYIANGVGRNGGNPFAVFMSDFKSGIFKNNVLVVDSAGATERDYVTEFTNSQNFSLSNWQWNNNKYFITGAWHSTYQTPRGFIYASKDAKGVLQRPDFAYTNATFPSVDGWKETTKFDTGSSYTRSLPSKNEVFVRKNAYERGRANIIIYNWENKNTQNITGSELASTGLSSGQAFEVRDAQNFYGNPVYSGTFSNQSLNLPTSISELQKYNNPISEVAGGNDELSQYVETGHTAPKFITYVVVPKTFVSPAVVTPPPTPIIPPSTKFSLGEEVQVSNTSTSLNVRSEPRIDAPFVSGSPVALNTKGVIKSTTSTPEQSGGILYHWWQVAYANGVTGWSVETYLSKYVPPVVLPDPIVSFNPSTYTVSSGTAVNLTFNTANTTSAYILPAISGCVVKNNTIDQVCSFTPTNSGTYTLYGVGNNKTVTGTANVTVKTTVTPPSTSGLPVINSFTGNGIADSLTLKGGSSLLLSWNTTNAKVVSLNYDFGLQNGTSKQISSPDAPGTYIYVLTATNEAGISVTKNLVVTTTTTTTITPPPAPTILPSTKFKSGDQVITTSALNVRTQPSTTASLVVGSPIAANSKGIIKSTTSTPQQTGSTLYHWWQIAYDNGMTGWSAEDYLIKYVAPAVVTPTASFKSSAYSVNSGGNVTLEFSTSNGASASITPGNCVVNINSSGQTCSITAGSVTTSTPTTYTLKVTSSTGHVATATTVLTVNPVGVVTPTPSAAAPKFTLTEPKAGQVYSFPAGDGAKEVTVAGTTDKAATCKIFDFSSVPTNFATQGGAFPIVTANNTSHKIVISVYTGAKLTYYARCADAAGNISDAVKIYVDVSSSATPTPLPTPTPTPSNASQYIEAESGILNSPLISVQSETGYLGTSYVSSTTGNSGSALYNISVPTAGTYYIFGRVMSKAASEDSFFVSVNGGTEDIWDTMEPEGVWSNSWQWRKVGGRNGTGTPGYQYPRPFTLNAGSNTLLIKVRDANTKLDKLFVTNSATLVPNDGGVLGATNTKYDFGTTTLKAGSRGDAVKELQRFLNENLGLSLVVDGILGPKTIAIVKDWQIKNGLVGDSIVGPKTKAAMNAL